MGQKKDTVLIVEDTEINIILLEKMLGDEYNVVVAGNGEQALACLEEPSNKIAAVLLDLMMPVMDGFQVMAIMQQKKLLHIPVIVMTGETDPVVEEKALVMGAVDFVPKPYKPRILKTRIANAIARSEITHLEQIRHTAEHDPLTDLYNRTTFFRQIMGYATLHENENMVFVRLDVRRFHLVNSLFGESTGDSLLIYIADKLREYVEHLAWGVYGRIESDIFGMFIPNDEEELVPSLEKLADEIALYRRDYAVSVVFGVYRVKASDYSAENMFMCASQASKAIKSVYTKRVGFYNIEMGEQMIREQEIVQDMKRALDDQEFIVYFQPKYDAEKKLPFGAEALVRWKHRDVGMISPGVFVPIFERNGFIGELDYYIWDHVCAAIRRWLDMGLDPAPISVNMSRADLSDPNLTANLTGLIKKYDLPPTMLYLELTESAYMDNPELMDQTLRSLHEAGFIILMDDFGSGYSSLNTLKDISVDILKIDMKFLSKDAYDVKSNKIINAVVQMAHSLYMPVIVEGVETEDQYEFLKDIGCEYIQGYFFSRPIPEEDYERMISSEEVKSGVAKIRQETFEKTIEEQEKLRTESRIGFSEMDVYGQPASFVKQGGEQLLDNMVYRDALTGVYNRNYIYDWRFFSEREKGRVSFLLIDLRWYTELREEYGQVASAELLKKVAKALMQVVGPRDVIVRYGGDVFLLMLKQVNDSMIPALVRRINKILAGLDWEGKDKFKLTADYGFSSVEDFERFYRDASHLDSMLHTAEVRLLYNKDKVEPIRKVVLLLEQPDSERE
ncbi:MAG: EAL domain-containing protein, partial [Lachnospiraceae bacterium]|nr:EAL domain-containing protein [Lachnospiraceae bacterium]